MKGKAWILAVVGSLIAIAGDGGHTLAQNVTLDGTLGPARTLTGPRYVIQQEDGQTVGSNLFHSFGRFSLDTIERADFLSANSIRNILARVTGGERSLINGLLFTQSANVNLFLINPNGIVFGPTAFLDIGGSQRGSFVATTMEALVWPNGAQFSAINPGGRESLLTIAGDPSGFLSSLRPPAPIAANFAFGLGVYEGQSLLLLGGDMTLDGSFLFVRSSQGGQIDLASVAGTGTVGLNTEGNRLTLQVPDAMPRADVTLRNQTTLDVTAADGGNVAITARNLTLSGQSRIRAGIGDGQGAVGRQAGNISINTTGTVRLEQLSQIRNDVSSTGQGNGGNIQITTGSLIIPDDSFIIASTFGRGNAGNVLIQATDAVALTTGDIFSSAEEGSIGNGGEIRIRTRSLSLNDGSQLGTNTFSNGQAGNITIDAEDITFRGADAAGFSSGAFSTISKQGVGTGGNINITTGNLSLLEGGKLSAVSFGRGTAGTVTVRASGNVVFDGVNANGNNSGAFGSLQSEAEGKGGSIHIQARSLAVTNGAQLSTSTYGKGDAGNIALRAQSILFSGVNGFASGAFSTVEEGAIGNGGNIEIHTDSLTAADGGQINANTLARGNAGSVNIRATGTVTFDGVNRNGRISGAFSDIGREAVGNGGNITITAQSIVGTNGGQISADIYGRGDAGKIQLDAESIRFDSGRNGTLGGVFSRVDDSANGNGGNLTIRAGDLVLANGSQLGTATFGSGNAGDITIEARSIEFAGIGEFASGAFSTVEENATGQGGDIQVRTDSLTVSDGARFNSSTSGRGNAGNIWIGANDRVAFDGVNQNGVLSGAFSSVNEDGIGQGGNITIAARSLFLTNGAELVAATEGVGAAGNISLRADDTIAIAGVGRTGFSTGAFSTVGEKAQGDGGNITLITGNLVLTDGGKLSTVTFGRGSAGNVTVQANDRILLTGVNANGYNSGIFSEVESGAIGEGGNIDISTRSMDVEAGAQLSSSTFFQGSAGKILIRASDTVTFDGFGSDDRLSGAFSNVGIDAIGDGGSLSIQARSLILKNNAFLSADTLGEGNAGDVAVSTQRLSLHNGAGISTSTFTQGRGGNIDIEADSVRLSENSQILASSLGTGEAGNITLQVKGRFSARDSEIGTAAFQSSGGNVRMTAKTIRLSGNSNITTYVLSGEGGGGEIALTADSILALADSDILSFARDGKGGNVTLKTPAFFGQNYRPAPPGTDPATLEGNDRVDINASGAVSGVISLPDTTFIQNGLTQLPQNIIDTSRLLANSCIVRSHQQAGTFFITGSGGLPEQPGDAPVSNYATGSVRSLPADQPRQNVKPGNASVAQRPQWQLGDPIVEPQGVYQLPNGQWVMSRECPLTPPTAADRIPEGGHH